MTFSSPRYGSVADFLGRARSRPLEYRGFVRTNGGVCIHCGKYPGVTHCLHAVHDPMQNQLLEYGSDCYPRFFLPALADEVLNETDPTQKYWLSISLNQLSPNRCCIADTMPPVGQVPPSLPPIKCVAGGYRFALQAVGSRTFTVQVHDWELSILGRFASKHWRGKTDQYVIGLPEADLIQEGELVRSILPPAKLQNRLNCKVYRLEVGCLTNRV